MQISEFSDFMAETNKLGEIQAVEHSWTVWLGGERMVFEEYTISGGLLVLETMNQNGLTTTVYDIASITKAQHFLSKVAKPKP